MRSMTYTRNSCSSGYMVCLFIVYLKFLGNMCPGNLTVKRFQKKWRKVTISFILSVRTGQTLDGFL